MASSAVIITKDEDFALRKVLTGNGPAVVWVRLPNTRRRDWPGFRGRTARECLRCSMTPVSIYRRWKAAG